MNPCPCGYYGDPEKECRCSAFEVFRYQKKISGPLLDRIDIQIHVPRVPIEELRAVKPNRDESQSVRERVLKTREIQAQRFSKPRKARKPLTNSEMSSKECDELIKLDAAAEDFIREMFDKSFISARGYYRILKTAQTIADLEESERVNRDHLAEAFSYRVRTEPAM